MAENTKYDPYENQDSVIAATKKATDKKCPSCGGVMDFDPAAQMMTCPYCGYQEEIAQVNQDFVAEELDFNSAEKNASCDWGMQTKTVICKSCGAHTVYDANKIASECPYCCSNQVMEEMDEKVMAPGGVLPFALDDQKASAAFKTWIGHKFFCPKLAKDSAKPKSFQGVYMPYWTFDAETKSSYRGEYGINRRVREKEGQERVVTDWHRTSGRYQHFFDDYLVCGSEGQNKSMIKALEPFPTKQAKEYRPEYMAGFSAEHYTVKLNDAWGTAKDGMQKTLQSSVESKIRSENHADSIRNVHLNTSFEDITYKYLLLPIWLSSFKYNDKIYHFMVNGQTGKVSGDTPVSAVKVAITVIAVILIILLVWYIST